MNNMNSTFYTLLHSSWPSDAIWWYKSGSTLAQVMACCLRALSQITWTNVDLSSNVFCCIQLWAISYEVLMNLIFNTCLDIYNFNITHHPVVLRVYKFLCIIQDIEAWAKMNEILHTTFPNVFCWKKFLYFDSNFTLFCSQGSNWK